MNMKIYKYSEIKDKIIRGIDLITDPIRQTLSPKGGNVLYEDIQGTQFITNDGVTIAKNISVAEPVENAIIEVIKHAALQTNRAVGDGTSTTILWSSIFTKGGLKLIDEGMNQMVVKEEYLKLSEKLKSKLKEKVIKIKNDKDLFFIAKISANNDEDIAKNTVKVIDTADEDGMIFIEPSNSKETEVVIDPGFIVNSGYFTPELVTDRTKFTCTYTNVPVLVTDKQIYYSEEAETILSTCLKNGYKEVVIVAKNFVGEALPYFIANHQKGNIKVLLVKNEKDIELEDLAVYLGGKVISEKTGSIVDNLQIDDFTMSPKIYADPVKTIIARNKKEKNKLLDGRIAAIKKELKKKGDKKDGEAKMYKDRLASLTNGMVTVRVGGATALEVKERIFRYEDAISASRAAKKDGYLVGGGLAIYNAYRSCSKAKGFDGEVGKVFKKVAEANIRQIAENCGLHPDTVLETINISTQRTIGYNAASGQYEDLLKAGVVDSFKAVEMSLDNAISIANVIVSSRYMMLNDLDELKKDDKSN